MLIDDDKPRPKNPPVTLRADLSSLSVPELQARIAALHDEIARTQTEMHKKQAHAAAAAAIFGKKP